MNRIKELREKIGLKQSDLATLFNVRQNSISNWETGRHDPDLDRVDELAALFGVSTDYLLGRDEKKEPTTEAGDGLEPEVLEMLRRVPPERMDEVKRFLRFQAEQKGKP